ncbi:hypothetical protein [Hoeflea sp. IMCC20628]|uniref:hypothetical protein n=1 Tax=Hoeflea sp. IMCC20628 TaxID=1620421 RepID=UPI00063B07DF|nr:hypothetical protein [Hoeflea sp. IMCC20628]
MSMMQFQQLRAFDGAERNVGYHEAIGSEFDFGADVNAGDGDIVPQQTAPDLEVLAGDLVAAFRAHSHINNVMTHISGARWDHVEHALHIILNSAAPPVGLSRLEANILDLICAERGVTGRIIKPFLETLLARLLPPIAAAQLQAHMRSLHEAQMSEEANPSFSRIAATTGSGR